MRTTLKLFFLLIAPVFVQAQIVSSDSLKQSLLREKQDTLRIQLLNELAKNYLYSKPDTALVLAQQALSLSTKAGYIRGEAQSLNRISTILLSAGNYVKALKVNIEALKKAEAVGDEQLVSRILSNTGNAYSFQGSYRQSIEYFLKSLAISKRLNLKDRTQNSVTNLGDAYTKLGLLDSAKYYTALAYDMARSTHDGDVTGMSLNNFGNIYSRLGKADSAMTYYRQSLPYYAEAEDDDGFCESYLGMAALFRKASQADSALHYAKLSLAAGERGGFIPRVMDANAFLTQYYTSMHNIDSAFVYQTATIAAKDSLFSQERQREFQSLSYDESLRQQQIEEAKKEATTQLKFKALFGGIVALLIVAFLLYRNNRQKQTANVQLTSQKQKVESTLQELKATQAQLVQSEKMASLGELTAGIAHEIQNPLNFVNNFSEINKEIIEELKSKNEKLKIEDEEINELLNDVKDNSEKINHHGKRADAIVRNMLQHSRQTKGVKEPADINALCDEYFRLAYHGIRAKEKNFNVETKTEFDPSISKVNIVPQDIGRVLLNLFNNAFYAVNERQKACQAELVEANYQPIAKVSTRKLDNKIEIKVEDNGTGIPQNNIDKIFQPFFTTKPTGQGTGLGLSLSYDIVKSHGGDINLQTTEGQGSTFIVQLPLS